MSYHSKKARRRRRELIDQTRNALVTPEIYEGVIERARRIRADKRRTIRARVPYRTFRVFGHRRRCHEWTTFA